MKTTVIVLALLTLAVGLAGVASAGPGGEGFGHCELVWYDLAEPWDSGTPLGTVYLQSPALECVW